MITKKLLTMILAVMIGFAPCKTYCMDAAANMQPGADMPQLDVSPDQLQKMETMMSEMQKFYNGLSEEEKAQFENELAAEVAKEQQKLESMDPGQQKEYIETAFRQFDEIDLDALLAEIEAEGAQEPMTSIGKPDKTKEEKEKKEKEEKENKEKIKKILDTIDKIIKILDSLTGKLNAILPGAQELVEKWINKGYITKWAGAKSNYDTFKGDLDQMRQKIEKLKDTDPKTDKYKYLDDIKQAEKLGGQLDMLLSTIKRYEPNVEITVDGKMKNEAAKSALKRLISYLVDTTKTISTSADVLVEKFEGKKGGAAKIRKEEESLAKKAERSQRLAKRRRGKLKEAGQKEAPEYDYGYGGYGSQDYGYSPDYGYGDSGYAPSDYADYGDYPDSSAPSYADKGKEPTTPGEKTPGKETPDKEKAPAAGTVSVPSAAKKRTEELKKHAPRAGKILDNLKSHLEDFSNVWTEDKKKQEGLRYAKNWHDLHTYIKTAGESDKALIEKVDEATQYLDNAHAEAKRLAATIKKEKDSKIKAQWKSEVADLYKEHEETVKKVQEKLSTAENIEKQDQVHETKQEDYGKIKELGKLVELFKNLEKATK